MSSIKSITECIIPVDNVSVFPYNCLIHGGVTVSISRIDVITLSRIPINNTNVMGKYHVLLRLLEGLAGGYSHTIGIISKTNDIIPSGGPITPEGGLPVGNGGVTHVIGGLKSTTNCLHPPDGGRIISVGMSIL